MKEYRKDSKDIFEDGIITLEEHEEIERHYRRDERRDAIEEGRKEAKIKMAKTMKANNEPIDKIKNYTQLTKKEINNISV